MLHHALKDSWFSFLVFHWLKCIVSVKAAKRYARHGKIQKRHEHAAKRSGRDN